MFTVLYRWQLKPGREAPFRKAWELVTEAFLADFGGLGSRLHKAADGSWIAYAQWPSEAAWQEKRVLPPPVEKAIAIMAKCAETIDVPIAMTVVSDYLLPAPKP